MVFVATIKGFPLPTFRLFTLRHKIAGNSAALKPNIPGFARRGNQSGATQWDNIDLFNRFGQIIAVAEVKTVNNSARRVAILHHFMYPDDVVSALHLDGLAQDLAAKGWQVEAFPCNRGCRDETKTYPRSDTYQGVRCRRIWRPGFSQKSSAGRLANSLWMIAAWSRPALRPRRRRPELIVVGTDPVFAAAAAIVLRLFAPGIKLAHWCFDMHPEAALAGGLLPERALSVRLARAVMRRAYRSFDLIADLGVCMRAPARLRTPRHRARTDDPLGAGRAESSARPRPGHAPRTLRHGADRYPVFGQLRRSARFRTFPRPGAGAARHPAGAFLPCRARQPRRPTKACGHRGRRQYFLRRLRPDRGTEETPGQRRHPPGQPEAGMVRNRGAVKVLWQPGLGPAHPVLGSARQRHRPMDLDAPARLDHRSRQYPQDRAMHCRAIRG